MKEIIYYEANDGTRFDDELDCIEYEKHLALSDLNMEIIFVDYQGNKLQCFRNNDFDKVYGIQITFPQEEKNYKILYEKFLKTIEDDIEGLPCWNEIALGKDNSIRIFFKDSFNEWICLNYYINHLVVESNKIFHELNEQNAY